MIDLDALKAELEAAGFTITQSEFTVLSWVRDGVAGWVTSEGSVAVNTVHHLDAFRIIARHVVPVVTPEPDAEARDVLAEAIERCDRGEDDCPDCPPTSHQMADAGLAALRARGFAVVRTADVEPRTCAGCKHYSCPAGEPWGICEAELMYAPHQLGPMREAAELRSDGKLPRRYWTVLPDFSCAAWEVIR